MIMELDQMIALSVLAVALPGAVITFNQATGLNPYSAFSTHLTSEVGLQGITHAAGIDNVTLQGVVGIAGKSWKNYTLTTVQQGVATAPSYISRMLVISGNAYLISVHGNESANLD